MPTPQRLPIVDSDDGVWGDIIRQYLMKEHYNDDTDNTANGGHQKVTIRPGVTSPGGAPLKFTTGTLLTTPEAGAMEFSGDNYYLTQTSSTTRKKIAIYDDSSGATGDIYYRNSGGYFTPLTAGSNGTYLTIAGGVPSWTSTIGSASITNTSTMTLKDTNFTLQDDGDVTKQVRFQLSGITTGTTRTITVPNASGTMYVSGSTDVSVADGGTGRSTNTTAYGIIAAGTTATGAMQTISPGSAGQFLKSAGSSALGSFASIVATDISDSTSVGRSVLTATDAAAARTAIGAGTGSGDVTVNGNQTLTNKTMSGSNNTFSNIPQSAVTSLTTDLAAKADVSHKYHSFADGDYYYDSYSQGRYLRMFVENAAYTTTRFESPEEVEYYDGSSWVTWSDGADEIKKLLDGREDTRSNIDRTHRHFRFKLLGKTYPLLTLWLVQTSWTAISFPGLTMRVYTSTTQGGTYTLRDTATFNSANGSTNWGSSLYVTDSLHNNERWYQIEIEWNDWTDSGSYTVMPMLRVEILSNYQGSSLLPFSWNWDKHVTGLNKVILPSNTTSSTGIDFGSDTNLYRSGANTLKTDDAFIIGNPGTSSGSAVTIDGTQTLTNKTHTGPRIDQVNDTNGNNILDYVAIGSAVNRFYLTNQSAGNYPTFGVDGSDTNIGLTLAPKGSGPVRIAVSSGQTPTIDVSGPSTNLDLNLVTKGSGRLKGNGVTIPTISSVDTLTNKTLTNPKINSIKDTNENNSLVLGATTNAVNYIQLSNAIAGSSPLFYAQGSDTNIGINFVTKGTGNFTVYDPSFGILFATNSNTPGSNVNYPILKPGVTGSPATFGAWGSDTNVGLDLTTKGTGEVTVNGSPIVVTADIDDKADVTNNSSGALLTGSNTIGSTIDTHPESSTFVNMPHLFNDLAYNNLRGGSIVWTKNGSSVSPSGADHPFLPDVSYASGFSLASTSDTIVAEVTTHQTFNWGMTWGIVMTPWICAKDVTIEVWDDTVGSWNTAYTATDDTTGIHWVGWSAPSGNDMTKVRYTLTNFISSSDVRITSLFGVQFNSPLLSGTFLPRGGGELYGDLQVPAIRTDLLRDANDNGILEIYGNSSATNYIQIQNRATGAGPGFYAQGSDTNIDIEVAPKGSGRLKSGGVIVPSISSSDTFTNKAIALGSNTITGTLAEFNTALTDADFATVADLAGKAEGTQVTDRGYAASTEYRLLATLPIDNSGNYCSITIAGRIGGWTETNMAQWTILLSNRSDYSGDNIMSAVIGTGNVDVATAINDIVIYKQTDKSALVYLKLDGYYTYDFSIKEYQATVSYTGGTTTPTGTQIWDLSGAPKLSVDKDGNVIGSVAPTAGSHLTNKDYVDNGTATLANKTLASARTNGFLDTNGNVILSMSPTASAVNYVSILNSVSGGGPAVVAEGSDTNINLYLAPKGYAGVVIYTGAGTPATIVADGVDANIDISLLPKGSGSAYVGSAQVATVSDSQTLTNKTISASSNTISNIAVSNLAASAVVTESEGIGSTDNDTTIPTSAAVKDYVDTAAGAGSIAWQEVTSTSQTAVANGGYIANNASLVTVTLPTTAAVGSTVRVIGKGAGGWRIAQNSGETIHFGASSTTAGTGGYIGSTNRYDTVEIVCVTANTTWVVASSVGNITVA